MFETPNDRTAEDDLRACASSLRYGLRVRVVGYSAAPTMRRDQCLVVFGPRVFGYKEDFRPVEKLNPA